AGGAAARPRLGADRHRFAADRARGAPRAPGPRRRAAVLRRAHDPRDGAGPGGEPHDGGERLGDGPGVAAHAPAIRSDRRLMDRARYQRLYEIFLLARAEPAAERRQAVLRDACADDAVLPAELERMLTVDSSPQELIATSAATMDLSEDAKTTMAWTWGEQP